MSGISDRPMGMKDGSPVEMDDAYMATVYDHHRFHSDGDSAAICSFIDEIRRLRAENAGLKPLAKLGLTAVVECAWQGCDFDGDVIQEGAEKFGAIVEAPEGYDPDLHGDSEFCDPGDRWYTFTPAVEAVRDALNEEMGS